VKAHRFEALDAWRGICALLVALEHLSTTSVLRQNALTHHSYRFVDFFFVLSGVVVSHAYRERLERDRAAVWPFLIRRVGRLWPLHITMLAVFIVVECGIGLASRAGLSLGHAAFTDRNTLGAIPANLALVHSWGMFDRLTWNTPSWSISTEFFAYMLFAAVCALAGSRRSGLLCAGLMIAGALVTALVAPLGMGSTFDYGLARCVYGFMAGVLVRSAWGRHAPRVGTAGEIAVVVTVVLAVTLLPVSPGVDLLVTPAFALAVWVFASEDGAISRVLKRRAPQALGAWSYSIYMVHVLVALGLLIAAMLASKHGLHLFARVDNVVTITGSAPVTAAITIGYLGAVILLSSVTYRFVELPGQRWFGRLAQRRQAGAASTA
jgi:peptidoglycan/LPS O-acetylase OafA/YrhL